MRGEGERVRGSEGERVRRRKKCLKLELKSDVLIRLVPVLIRHVKFCSVLQQCTVWCIITNHTF